MTWLINDDFIWFDLFAFYIQNATAHRVEMFTSTCIASPFTYLINYEMHKIDKVEFGFWRWFEEVIRVISIGAIRSKAIDNAGPVFNMP